jgi:hypothetical protein
MFLPVMAQLLVDGDYEVFNSFHSSKGGTIKPLQNKRLVLSWLCSLNDIHKHDKIFNILNWIHVVVS